MVKAHITVQWLIVTANAEQLTYDYGPQFLRKILPHSAAKLVKFHGSPRQNRPNSVARHGLPFMTEKWKLRELFRNFTYSPDQIILPNWRTKSGTTFWVGYMGRHVPPSLQYELDVKSATFYLSVPYFGLMKLLQFHTKYRIYCNAQ